MAADALNSLPLEVELEGFGIDGNNNVWVRVRFADGAEWDLEWAPNSPAVGEIFDFFSQLATELLADVGGRGLAITGLTPVEEEDEE